MNQRLAKLVDTALGTVKNLEGMVDLSILKDRKILTNEKILSSLKSIGVASQAEVDALKARVEELEKKLSLKA